jgi:hypothetical protein
MQEEETWPCIPKSLKGRRLRCASSRIEWPRKHEVSYRMHQVCLYGNRQRLALVDHPRAAGGSSAFSSSVVLVGLHHQVGLVGKMDRALWLSCLEKGARCGRKPARSMWRKEWARRGRLRRNNDSNAHTYPHDVQSSIIVRVVVGSIRFIMTMVISSSIHHS